jgi:hypothetical protein
MHRDTSHVESLCFQYFRCFGNMLKVFHMYVAKVDRDVAHVAMAIHVCFKRMFQMFYLFHTYVASVSFRCYKTRSECCISMQMF